MSKKALIFLANGTEETELVTTADLLRRANITVKIAGDNELVTCSRGVKIVPDILIEQVDILDEFDVVILPGGNSGVYHLSQNIYVQKLIKHYFESKVLIAAICAAPSILIENKIINTNTFFTGFPSLKEEFPTYNYIDEKVVYDEESNILTSQSLGTTIPFALSIIELILDKNTSNKIIAEIIF